VSRIAEIDPTQRTIKVERRAEGGTQVLSTRMPCLITMLEATNEIRRGSLSEALRAARASVVKWSAADAGIEDTSKCGLKGSPTIVKKVFAPGPRSTKALFVEPGDQSPAEVLIAEIFKQQPELESKLTSLARGY
jgi:electron transfer flavoprotein beta subunit